MKELIMVIMILAYLIFCAFIWYFRNRNNQDLGFIVWVVGWIVIILSILIRYIWGWIKMKLESLKNVEKRCKCMIDEMIELIDKAGKDNETD